MKKTVVFLSFVFLNVVSVWAQTPPSLSDIQQQQAERQRNAQLARDAEQQREQRQREFERLRSVSENPVSIVKRESYLPLLVKPNKEQRKLLEPNGSDLAGFAVFLKQPNTGLIKLFPADGGCEENARVLRADDNCLNWIPGSAFYSFRKREHSAEVLSDIRYKNGFLISDGLFSQGIFVVLGNAAIENVSLQNEGMKFLVEYRPEMSSEEALKQSVKITKGIKIGKYEYKNTVPVRENMTYALRVIAYQGRVYQSFRGQVFNVLDGDKRADLTLAFRIVRRDENGTLTLVWKELDRRPSPKVIFPKRKKQT